MYVQNLCTQTKLHKHAYKIVKLYTSEVCVCLGGDIGEGEKQRENEKEI